MPTQGILERLGEKVTFIEKRTMNENMKPHEAVRQIQLILDSFDVRGDTTWPLRSIRDICLDIMRTLSTKYYDMRTDTKSALTKLVVFEACRRHAWGLKEDVDGIEKYELIVHLCRTIETYEGPDCSVGRFLQKGQ